MVSIAEIPSSGGASEKDCGSCNPNGQCGNGLEKVYPTCAVTYGYLGHIGEFRYAPGMLFGCGQKVIIQSERGTEVGSQKSLTCSGCSKSISRDQILDYVHNSGPDFMRLHAGRILRAATPQDIAENDKQQRVAAEMLAECKQIVRRVNLPMKMVACEYLLGGERAVFYFLSESRIDFRDLVHELARLYHTRIEMRQVGARDEARIVADYEICGRECCCKNFLKTLRPITMQMAKIQKATLDPSKVSGRCGRLRCCLRYEHETYAELDKKLPKVGKRIRVADGVGVIVDRQVLTQLVLVAFPDDRRVAVPAEEILEVGVPAEPLPPPGPPPANPRGDRGRPPRFGPRPESPGDRGPADRGPGGDDRRHDGGAATGPHDATLPNDSVRPGDAPRSDEGPPSAETDSSGQSDRPADAHGAGGGYPDRDRRRRRRRRGRSGRERRDGPGGSGDAPPNDGGGGGPDSGPPGGDAG